MNDVYLGLGACFVSIFLGGSYLTKLGDRIASRTTLGHHLMGVVFLALVTSLPELAAGVSAVVWKDLPNIGFGEVMGSCCFNLMILGVADFFSRKPVAAIHGRGSSVNAGTSIILLTLAVGALVGPQWNIAHFGAHSIVIVLVYLASLEASRRVEMADQEAEEAQEGEGSIGKLWLLFAFASVFVVAPGVWLPDLADKFAKLHDLSDSFVGAFLVGVFTSAPEIVVTFHCIRSGLGQMAMGNIIGSNLFNILVLAVIDFSYVKGSLYPAAAGGGHTVLALLAIVMTATCVVGGGARAEAKEHPRFRFEALLLIGLYLLAFFYLAGRSA